MEGVDTGWGANRDQEDTGWGGEHRRARMEAAGKVRRPVTCGGGGGIGTRNGNKEERRGEER